MARNYDYNFLTLVFYEMHIVYHNITRHSFYNGLKDKTYMGINMLINKHNCDTYEEFCIIKEHILTIFNSFGSYKDYNIIMNHPLNDLDPSINVIAKEYLNFDIRPNYDFVFETNYIDVSKYKIRYIKPFINKLANIVNDRYHNDDVSLLPNVSQQSSNIAQTPRTSFGTSVTTPGGFGTSTRITGGFTPTTTSV
jgi:hypothetical protein